MGFDWQPLLLSLKVAAAAAVLAMGLGVPAACFMRRRHVPGRHLIEAVFLLPLVLPPVVTGYVLLVLLGRNSQLRDWHWGPLPMGRLLPGHLLDQWFDIRLLFTPWAAVLAAAAVAFPLVYQSARAAFVSIDPYLEDVARSLGANGWHVFRTVSAPLAVPGLMAGAILAFARAMGEFGATIMVAGNIAGRTMTAPAAIYLSAEDGDLYTAGIYSAVMAAFNLLFIISLNLRIRRRR